MSTNITSVEMVSSDSFGLDKEVFEKLHYAYLKEKLETAECSFFDGIDNYAKLDGEFYEFHSFSWSGTWSGNSYDFLLKEILPKFKGTADIIFTWEGGQMGESGVRITNGKVKGLNIIKTLSE